MSRDTHSFVVILVVFLLAIYGPVILPWSALRIGRIYKWLKGSRTTYYKPHTLDPKEGRIASTKVSLRKGLDMFLVTFGSVIEINRGFWRRPSVIHKMYPSSWEIGKTFKSLSSTGIDTIELRDPSAMSVDLALHIVNGYSSIESMFNEIEELKKKLDARDRNEGGILAAISVIHNYLVAGKTDRYRSQVVAGIREDIEVVLNTYLRKDSSKEDITEWEERLQTFRDSRAVRSSTPPLRSQLQSRDQHPDGERARR